MINNFRKMKKINIISATVVAVLFSFMACDNGTSTKAPKLSNQIDSLNYVYGLVNGSDMVRQLPQDSDSIDYRINSFIKGFKESLKGDKDENPQFAGIGNEIGGWLANQKKVGLFGDSTLKVNYDLLRQGMVNAIKGEKLQMTSEQAQQYINATMKARQEKMIEKQYGAKKEEAIKYMEENKTKDGVQTTESGLQYQILKEGTGAKPTIQDMVKVHYHGTLTNDSVFDSSVKRGEPVVFGVSQVIPGWTEGLQLMNVGSKYRFYVPYNLAYGAQGTPSIPPFSVLIFDVELLSIEK